MCGDTKYRILRKEEHLTGWIDQPAGQVFQVKAYAICESNGLDDTSAEKIIDEYLHPKTVINEEVILNCINNKIPDKNQAYDETEKLISEQRYAESITCLLNIVSTEDEAYINKKAYTQLSVMYEIGLGVEPDKVKAASYSQKSGL